MTGKALMTAALVAAVSLAGCAGQGADTKNDALSEKAATTVVTKGDVDPEERPVVLVDTDDEVSREVVERLTEMKADVTVVQVDSEAGERLAAMLGPTDETPVALASIDGVEQVLPLALEVPADPFDKSSEATREIDESHLGIVGIWADVANDETTTETTTETKANENARKDVRDGDK